MTSRQTSTFTREEALEITTRALEMAKRAKSFGQDVKEARRLMRGCRDALEAGDYRQAVCFAEEVLRIFGGIPPRHR